MKFLLLLLLFTGYLSAQTITIAAAANMKYAIEDIAKVFTNNTGKTNKQEFEEILKFLLVSVKLFNIRIISSTKPKISDISFSRI